jgi:hypothetical protein
MVRSFPSGELRGMLYSMQATATAVQLGHEHKGHTVYILASILAVGSVEVVGNAEEWPIPASRVS